MESLVLIDTSYTSFYRFFATLRWLTLSQPEIYKEHINNPNYKWIEDTNFLEKYEKMYLESIIKLVGKKIYNKAKLIFCMDTPKEQVWRTTQLKCDYKAGRIDQSEKNDYKPIFKYTYDIIIPKIINTNNNISKLRIDNLEADDVIAIICKNYNKLPIYLISGDEDFLQLGRDNIKFLNYKSKTILELTENEAQYKLHNKILLGDKSDCIPSIFPKRFNSKLKKELLESIEKFNKWINENQDIKKSYQHNRELIDFNYIPKKFDKIVLIEFNKLFS